MDHNDANTVSKDCGYEGCNVTAHYTCSRCKKVRYCSVEHQKLDFKQHKLKCLNKSPTTQQSIEPSAQHTGISVS